MIPMIPESWMKVIILALLFVGITGEVILAIKDSWDDDEDRRGGKNDDVS